MLYKDVEDGLPNKPNKWVNHLFQSHFCHLCIVWKSSWDSVYVDFYQQSSRSVLWVTDRVFSLTFLIYSPSAKRAGQKSKMEKQGSRWISTAAFLSTHVNVRKKGTFKMKFYACNCVRWLYVANFHRHVFFKCIRTLYVTVTNAVLLLCSFKVI